MNDGGIEIKEMIIRAKVEGRRDEAEKTVQRSTGISKMEKEAIIRECLDKVKEWYQDNIER